LIRQSEGGGATSRNCLFLLSRKYFTKENKQAHRRKTNIIYTPMSCVYKSIKLTLLRK